MGVVASVGFDHFPKQGNHLGKRVVCCFRYNTQQQIGGVCVRDDMEVPFRTIFKLDEGRYIEADECQYKTE